MLITEANVQVMCDIFKEQHKQIKDIKILTVTDTYTELTLTYYNQYKDDIRKIKYQLQGAISSLDYSKEKEVVVNVEGE